MYTCTYSQPAHLIHALIAYIALAQLRMLQLKAMTLSAHRTCFDRILECSRQVGLINGSPKLDRGCE